MTHIAHPYRTPSWRDDAGHLSEDVLSCLVALATLVAWAALRLAVSCIRGADLDTILAVFAASLGLLSFVQVRRHAGAVVRIVD